MYDAADELTSSTVPGDHTTTYTYTDAGLPATTTDPNGHTTTTAYDVLGLVTSVTNPDGKVTTYGYDGDGRQTSVTLPSGDESTETYDDAGQETSSTDAAGKTTTYAYNDDGELTSTTDPLDRVTTETYTADAQLQTVTLPDSSTETSTYNADGQVTDFENSDGQHTTYSYDNAGLLTSKTEPGSVTTSYTYNTVGLLQVTTNPDSSTVTDSYNPGGLLTGVAYSASSGADVSYSYDADNLRTGMTDATGTSSYSYNSRGLMTSETNAAGATIGYGYDAASQLTSITYPGDNTVTYGYDDAGQMTSLTDSASNETDFTWTDDGQLATQADPNGITQTRTYDADDRTTGISTADGDSTVADYTYGYDDDSELTADSTIDPNNSTALTHTYSYDSDSQLTTVDNGTTSPSYANTPGGEITTNTAGSTLAYNSADELTSVTPGAGPSTSYAYDDNGDRTSSTVGATETTSASTTSYGYDPAGNLASVAIPATGSTDAVTVDYTSDGDGLRQSRTVGTTTTDFLWDTNASVPLLLDDGTYRYLYGPSSAPIAEVNDSTGTIRYLTSDLIGSTRLITSSSGSVVGVNIYDEYGNLETHTGTATSPIGYSGNWTDPDTGLVYLRARDYDPVTAQFLTVDPLVDSTRQPYAYVADNPLTQTDPSGCDFWNDLLNNVAVGLMHGPGADVASVLEGIGDGASFGLTDQVRQLMGTDCEVQKNGFYFAGLIGGAIASTVVTAGIGSEGDVADAGEAIEDSGASEAADIGEDATESVGEHAGEDAADDTADTCTVGGQSFSASTPVVLANGTTEPIVDVRVGQKVKAVDTRNGKDVIRTVSTLWVKHDTDLLDVTVTNSAGASSTVHTTAHHLFWDLTTNSWVQADTLNAGDRLRSDDGTSVTFARSAVVLGAAYMWDLTVIGAHDFYVATPTTTILVHNNNCSFASTALRDSHFGEHGSDYGAQSPEDYEEQASEFLSGPKSASTLEKVRANGDIVKFDPSSDEFGVLTKNSIIKTYFRPDPAIHGYPTNLDYFNAQ